MEFRMSPKTCEGIMIACEILPDPRLSFSHSHSLSLFLFLGSFQLSLDSKRKPFHPLACPCRFVLFVSSSAFFFFSFFIVIPFSLLLSLSLSLSLFLLAVGFLYSTRFLATLPSLVVSVSVPFVAVRHRPSPLFLLIRLPFFN